MEIKIVGVNVINGEQVFHRMVDSSFDIPKGEEGKFELLPPKTVHSFDELQAFQDEMRAKFNAIHPEGCYVYVSYSTNVATKEQINKIEFAITDAIEANV